MHTQPLLSANHVRSGPQSHIAMLIKVGKPLETEFPATALLWLAGDNRRQNCTGVRANLQRALTVCVFEGINYLCDVATALASNIVATMPPLPGEYYPEFPSEVALAPPTDVASPDYLHALAIRLVAGGDEFMTVLQRFVHACGANEWQKIQFETCETPQISTDQIARFNAIFGTTGYATECRYKGHGDFLIYALLRSLHVAPWRASTLLARETPYAIVARAHGPDTNGVVRQYLDQSSVALLQEHRGTVTAFIVAASILMELAPSQQTVLCVNRDLLRVDRTVPRMFVTSETPQALGILRYGCCVKNEGRIFTTPEAAIISYITAAHEHNVEAVGDLYAAITCPEQLSAHSPLKRYV